MYDIIVVGGGPVGATAARLSARAGHKTLLIEEHATIGDPIQCAGLLSSSAFAECEVSDRSVYNTVSGARIVSGAGDELLFDAGVTKAYVVDRSSLDREMMMAAGDAGAEIRVKSYARWIRPGLISVQGSSGSEEIPHRICIAADGPRSSIARAAGLGRHRYLLSGIQADIPLECDPRYVELHPAASTDFFGWMIPISPTRARVGLCGLKGVPERFNRFIGRYNDTSVHLATGAIPLGPLGQTYADRLMICGDAAGFPKPTSGGGIYTGIRSARHAAATAVRALESDDTDESRLSEYEDLWKADFGRELSLGLRLFEMRGKMTEDDINLAIQKLSQPDILRIIVEEGDMDRPGRLIRRLMRRPDLLSLFGRIGMTTILRSLI